MEGCAKRKILGGRALTCSAFLPPQVRAPAPPGQTVPAVATFERARGYFAVMATQRLRALISLPEVNISIFSLLLNYPWELLQAPFFAGMAEGSHWKAVKTCSFATVGDGVISLVAFWSVAAVTRNRHWIVRPRPAHLIGFLAVGFAITLVGERLATGVLNRWQYSALMPVIPGLEAGLAPVLQWLVLPPLVVWFARVQIAGLRHGRAD